MELTIPSLTVNLVGLNALICFIVIIVVWAYMFGRVKFSQAILGAFCCAVLMLLENILDRFFLRDNSFIMQNAVLFTLYIAATVAILRAAAQYGVIRTVLANRFDGTDAAVGFAIGFAALELIVGGISNLTSYTLCVTCNNEGLASILAQASSPEEAALLESTLRQLAESNSWDQIFSCVNRIFYLLQCVCVAVLCWYAHARQEPKVLLLAMICHTIVRLPYGLYCARLLPAFTKLTSFRLEELLTYALTLGFAAITVRYYNQLEGGKFHFKGDRLSTRHR